MIHSSQRVKPLVWVTILAVFFLAISFFAEAYTFASPDRGAFVAAADNTAVTTYKEDNARSGNHATETLLTTSNVNVNQFGKRISYPVDGQVYTQPLYLPNLTVNGSSHNVVFAATEHDSIYAFDADATSAIAPLWHTSFVNPPAVTVPQFTDVSCTDMQPDNGLSGTPVIDRATGTLYAVALTKENGQLVYRLHALDVATGQEKPGSPIVITASVPGTGAGSVNGQVKFNPQTERQRASPLLANGKIYFSFGSFCDNDPYHGWIMSYSYNGSSFQQANVYNSTANGTRAGIWGAGGALSSGTDGNIYFVSGNGTFDLNTGGVDAGDSLVKLNAQLQVQDYFAPFNQKCLENEDADLGSGGTLLIPAEHRLLNGGKEGRIYNLDTTNMGGYHTIADVCNNQSRVDVDTVPQELPPSTTGGLYGNPAYWKSADGKEYVYFGGANDNAKAFSLSNGLLSTTPTSRAPESFGFTGANMTVSSNNGAAGTGIVWALDTANALRAYDATNLSNELYNSKQNSSRDGLDTYVKFTSPTVANGEVFIGSNAYLNIFGLLSPSVTPTPTTTPTTTPTPTPVPAYNNVGITNDSDISAGNFDTSQASYSAQALQQAGLNAGDNAFDPTRTVVFTWPNAAAGTADNYQANGQVIPITPMPNATILAFLGAATHGPSSGTATITYTDGSTSTFTLGFSDWTLNGGKTSTPSFGNSISYTATYRNNRHLGGKESVKTYVFYVSVNLQAGKTIASIKLPTSVSSGQLHVFAITTK